MQIFLQWWYKQTNNDSSWKKKSLFIRVKELDVFVIWRVSQNFFFRRYRSDFIRNSIKAILILKKFWTGHITVKSYIFQIHKLAKLWFHTYVEHVVINQDTNYQISSGTWNVPLGKVSKAKLGNHVRRIVD